jgi:hypothetical protein
MKVFYRTGKHVTRGKAMWLKVRSFNLCLGYRDIISASGPYWKWVLWFDVKLEEGKLSSGVTTADSEGRSVVLFLWNRMDYWKRADAFCSMCWTEFALSKDSLNSVALTPDPRKSQPHTHARYCKKNNDSQYSPWNLIGTLSLQLGQRFGREKLL